MDNEEPLAVLEYFKVNWKSRLYYIAKIMCLTMVIIFLPFAMVSSTEVIEQYDTISSMKTIEENLDFSKEVFKEKVDFSNTIFKGSVNFIDTVFLDNVDFSNSIFEERVVFAGAVFNEKVDFSSVRFMDTCSFLGTTFNRNVLFRYSVFNSYASFSGSVFNEKVDYTRSYFEQTVDFNRVEFLSESVFNWASFNYETTFSESIFNEVSFHKSYFHHIVDFRHAHFMGKTIFNNVVFENEAWFWYTFYHDDVQFYSTTFKKEARFTNCKFSKDVYYQWVKFDGVAGFQDSEFGGRLFFSNTDFRHGVSFEDNRFPPQEDKFKLPQAEQEASRVQKLTFEKEGNKAAADLMYLREMRALREDKIIDYEYHGNSVKIVKKPLIKNLDLYALYWLELFFIDISSEYGTNWARMIVFGFILVVIFTVLCLLTPKLSKKVPCFGGIYSKQNGNKPVRSITELLWFSSWTFFSISSNDDFYPKGWLMKLFTLAHSIAGIVYVALIIVIIVRTWMR